MIVWNILDAFVWNKLSLSITFTDFSFFVEPDLYAYLCMLMQMLIQAASSLACARKGWVNVDVDKVECESCGAVLKFVSSASWTPFEGESFLYLMIGLNRSFPPHFLQFIYMNIL